VKQQDELLSRSKGIVGRLLLEWTCAMDGEKIAEPSERASPVDHCEAEFPEVEERVLASGAEAADAKASRGFELDAIYESLAA